MGYPEVVIAAVARVKVYGLASLDDFFNRGDVDDWIVQVGHPLGMVPGTPQARFNEVVREALAKEAA